MSNSSIAPSRRAVVRGAAWTVPVVTIAVTAPAFAASTDASSASASPALKWSLKDDVLKHVSWDLSFTTGTVAVTNVAIDFTYIPNGGGGTGTFYALDIYTFSPSYDPNWVVTGIPPGSGTNAATATHNSPVIPANSTTTIHTDFRGTDNSTGTVTATIRVTYAGSPTEYTLPTITVPWSQASPGSQEPAPHTGHHRPVGP